MNEVHTTLLGKDAKIVTFEEHGVTWSICFEHGKEVRVVDDDLHAEGAALEVRCPPSPSDSEASDRARAPGIWKRVR